MDNQFRINSEHAANCETQFHQARNSEDTTRNIQDMLARLKPLAEDCKRSTDKLFWAMNEEYEKIAKGRKADERTWEAARVLDHHVSTIDIATSRDDILRHVLQLTHTRIEQVEDDMEITCVKMQIDGIMLEALGDLKFAELNGEKKFLSADSVDF